MDIRYRYKIYKMDIQFQLNKWSEEKKKLNLYARKFR